MASLLPLAALAANFSVTPTNLLFGNVPAGATKSIIVKVTNISGIARTPNFSGGAPFDATNFGGSQACAGLTLPAGGSCNFTYEFTPKSLGAKSSGTTIGVDAENFSITMSGTGTAAFTLAPTNLAFGNVVVGSTGTIIVKVTNISGVAQSPNFSGGAPLDPTNFGGSQACAGLTLPAGGSCNFTYEFTPKSLGPKSSSTTIGIDTQSFALTMTGTGAGSVGIAPTDLDFGAVLIGQTSSKTVTVTNTSGASQTISATGGADPPFTVTQNCNGATLGNGATCKFTYTFTPVSTGFAVSTSNLVVNGTKAAIQLVGSGSVASAALPTTVVEFYNAALDHYFITYLADEIAKLDAGVQIKGWKRTGLSFQAFAASQAGATDICRIYIIPVHGDSHFFGRGQQECDNTMTAHPDFTLEASKFMAMFLPVAGACPAGTVPVYRVFSNRADANHRYVTNKALRDVMVAEGWLAEGDGPDAVVLCAPP